MPLGVFITTKANLLARKYTFSYSFTAGIDEYADQMVCPTLSQIRDEAQAVADKKAIAQNPAIPCKFGKTWWKLYKCCNSAFG